MITLSVLSVDDWRLWRELRLEALREAPYAFGSTLSEWQGLGDLERRWRERLTSAPLNIIACFDGIPAGMVSAIGPDDHNSVELISMWVAPFARGRSVSDALIEAVILWSNEQDASRVVLEVREENKHAIALYTRKGFVDSGEAMDVPEDAPRERLMVCPLSPE
ncbi:MAG: GNAT family N-acetyltransferase [Vulcanimicrobiaceae bacterium]